MAHSEQRPGAAVVRPGNLHCDRAVGSRGIAGAQDVLLSEAVPPDRRQEPHRGDPRLLQGDDDDLKGLPPEPLRPHLPEGAAFTDDVSDGLGLHQEQPVPPGVVAQVDFRLLQRDELAFLGLPGLYQLGPYLGVHHSPMRKSKHSFSSRSQITQCLLKIRVCALCCGREIFTNMQPTIKASMMEPRMDWTIRINEPSGQLAVTILEPYPMVLWLSSESSSAERKPSTFW
ncbi:unnamed protein product [Menidia menidia]|uniref:(Atlantic silverside) hypothetical protein n=1 Tax=Menidia menidia TaxID=238744 RepID=A0A8S4AH44_9TELE|nr:unnamed protein product [Menidia menidia]